MGEIRVMICNEDYEIEAYGLEDLRDLGTVDLPSPTLLNDWWYNMDELKIFRWLRYSTFYIYPYGNDVDRYSFDQDGGERSGVCVMGELGNVEELE
jgi:hypothetical protein